MDVCYLYPKSFGTREDKKELYSSMVKITTKLDQLNIYHYNMRLTGHFAAFLMNPSKIAGLSVRVIRSAQQFLSNMAAETTLVIRMSVFYIRKVLEYLKMRNNFIRQ